MTGNKELNAQAGRRVPLVLIVYDDRTTAVILLGILQKAGFSVHHVTSLGEAREFFQSRKVSLILLDVHLPDGNGLDFCRYLARISSVPVLFISGDSDTFTKTEGFRAGGVDYITKPLIGREVLARVRTHLRLVAAREALVEFHARQISTLQANQVALMPRPEDFPAAGFRVYIKQVLEAGGDFYDVIPLGDRLVDYVVADASGHDLGTSLWTASLKTLLAQWVSALESPRDICRSLNDALKRILPPGHYFTMLYIRLDRVSQKLYLVNAGHPAPLLLKAGDSELRFLETEGDVLGAFPDALFGEMELDVSAGDRLLLFTDGLVESCGDREKGTQLLARGCHDVMALPLDSLVDRVVEHMALQDDFTDDIVLLGVEV